MVNFNKMRLLKILDIVRKKDIPNAVNTQPRVQSVYVPLYRESTPESYSFWITDRLKSFRKYYFYGTE
jgi:hypothetical protein